MNDDILDSPIEEKKKRRLQSKVIPLIILWVGVFLSFISGEPLFWLVGVLTLLATILYFRREQFFVFLTMGIFLLGVIQLIIIYPFRVLIGIVGIEVDLLSLMGLILVVLLNPDPIRSALATKPSIKAASKKSKVDTFKRRFARRNREELEEISVNEELVEEARLAAQMLLAERNES